MLATAESCTGGMIGKLITDIAGSSEVFERGFITYSDAAKHEMLGVPAELIARHGAVCAQVAEAMAAGAIAHSQVQIAIAVTGIAGPGGGSAQKPVGLVHIAVAGVAVRALTREFRFVDDGRDAIRREAAGAALEMVIEQSANP